MVGEALMRISNTMEAERLTKSLDYQEKLRSRANIRLIIGIICMFIAFMLLLLSGMLLFILLRYEDPILDVWVPLIKAILHGMNVSFQATVRQVVVRCHSEADQHLGPGWPSEPAEVSE